MTLPLRPDLDDSGDLMRAAASEWERRAEAAEAKIARVLAECELMDTIDEHAAYYADEIRHALGVPPVLAFTPVHPAVDSAATLDAVLDVLGALTGPADRPIAVHPAVDVTVEPGTLTEGDG